MKRVDAIAVYELVTRALHANFTGESFETIQRDFVNLTTEAEGKPGTGACICMLSPEHIRKTAAHFNEHVVTTAERVNLVLDHRCPHHGEKAQPALWGRHKEKELSVKWNVWVSLGVERTP